MRRDEVIRGIRGVLQLMLFTGNALCRRDSVCPGIVRVVCGRGIVSLIADSADE
jgi:hypothetical protein